MGAIQLRVGMSVDEVRALLRGWREVAPTAFLSSDRTHLYLTINFAPPAPSDPSMRMTFDNGKLLIWGEPADPGDERSSAAG